MNIGSAQFIYVAMMQDTPYEVKIGRSGNPIVRERGLFSAGVAEPYHMLHIWQVHDMVHVEKRVIQPWLEPFRSIYDKEIFYLAEKYPYLIDPTVCDSVNGLNLANKLAEDINSYLKQCNIAFRRVTYDELERYNAAIQEQRKSLKATRN